MNKMQIQGQNLLLGLTYLQNKQNTKIVNQNSEMIRQNERANQLSEQLVENSAIQINQNAEIIKNLNQLGGIADEHLALDKKIYAEQQRDKYVKNLIFEITEEINYLNGTSITVFEKKLVAELILSQFSSNNISHKDVSEISDKERLRDLQNELVGMSTLLLESDDAELYKKYHFFIESNLCYEFLEENIVQLPDDFDTLKENKKVWESDIAQAKENIKVIQDKISTQGKAAKIAGIILPIVFALGLIYGANNPTVPFFGLLGAMIKNWWEINPIVVSVVCGPAIISYIVKLIKMGRTKNLDYATLENNDDKEVIELIKKIENENAFIDSKESLIGNIDIIKEFNRDIHNELSNTAIKDAFIEEVDGIRYTKELVDKKKNELITQLKGFAAEFSILNKYV